MCSALSKDEQVSQKLCIAIAQHTAKSFLPPPVSGDNRLVTLEASPFVQQQLALKSALQQVMFAHYQLHCASELPRHTHWFSI